jgi:hypothetical protein
MESEEVSWNISLETLIGKEGEKCSGLAWLYTEAERYYSSRNNFIALPVIILSTVTGFVSGSSQMIFSSPSTASIGVGAVSLFTGILSTVGSYFSWAKKTEACRITALQYSKLLKFITIEMTLPKNERIRARDMLKMIRETVERLLETGPAIPQHIIEEYNKKFGSLTSVTHPEMTTGIIKLEVNHGMETTETVKKVEVKPSNIRVTLGV